jgi:hypothetical protein
MFRLEHRLNLAIAKREDGPAGCAMKAHLHRVDVRHLGASEKQFDLLSTGTPLSQTRFRWPAMAAKGRKIATR